MLQTHSYRAYNQVSERYTRKKIYLSFLVRIQYLHNVSQVVGRHEEEIQNSNKVIPVMSANLSKSEVGGGGEEEEKGTKNGELKNKTKRLVVLIALLLVYILFLFDIVIQLRRHLENVTIQINE